MCYNVQLYSRAHKVVITLLIAIYPLCDGYMSESTRVGIWLLLLFLYGCFVCETSTHVNPSLTTSQRVRERVRERDSLPPPSVRSR